MLIELRSQSRSHQFHNQQLKCATTRIRQVKFAARSMYDSWSQENSTNLIGGQTFHRQIFLHGTLAMHQLIARSLNSWCKRGVLKEMQISGTISSLSLNNQKIDHSLGRYARIHLYHQWLSVCQSWSWMITKAMFSCSAHLWSPENGKS